VEEEMVSQKTRLTMALVAILAAFLTVISRSVADGTWH